MKRTMLVFVLAASAGTACAETSVSTVATGLAASGGVAVGPDGDLYVADFGETLRTAGGANVYRISPEDGNVEILSDAFGGASGNAFGPDGDLYQSDVGRGEAHRIAMDGSRTLIASDMQTPVGIAPAQGGIAYVTNCGPNRILRIDPDGTTRIIAEGGPLNCPNGLAFGGDGQLYAANFSDGAVVRIAPDSGEMAVLTILPTNGNGHLGWANGRFYVTGYRDGRIYSVTLDGAICHIAGSGARANEDGDGLAASFFRPNGAAISADGDTLYTNTSLTIVERTDPQLHPNAVRRIDGLLTLLDCPDDRRVDAVPPEDSAG